MTSLNAQLFSRNLKDSLKPSESTLVDVFLAVSALCVAHMAVRN